MIESRFERALGDVSKIFRNPQAIAGAEDLTSKQKIDLLRQWETDLRLLMVASEENMTGGTSGCAAELLRVVLGTLWQMGASDNEAQQAPNKSGGA